MNLKDKVAIIIGAQRGIGFAIAERFIHGGAYVVLADINNAESGSHPSKVWMQCHSY